MEGSLSAERVAQQSDHSNSFRAVEQDGDARLSRARSWSAKGEAERDYLDAKQEIIKIATAPRIRIVWKWEAESHN